jgi:hypothetical protein
MQERKPGLAIVFCSGYPDLIAANDQKMNGDRFIRKPYSARELSAKIEPILRGARSAAPVVSSQRGRP